MSCIYCDSDGPYNEEHVLTRAFAGPSEDWTLEDNLVCEECNSRFSRYERVWTSAPFEALARIHSGPAGRERSRAAYQIHPSESIFMVADDDPIAYEVNVLRGLEPVIRAQIILASDKLTITAGTGDEAKRMHEALNAFWSSKEITVQKRVRKSEKQYRIAVLSLDEKFSFSKFVWRPKPANCWLEWFPSNFRWNPDPRVSVDANSRPRFRVQKLRQVIELLNCMLSEGKITSAGRTRESGSYTVQIGTTFSDESYNKIFRAVAKTIVNYATDQFGPKWITSSEFRPILDYCIERTDPPENAPIVGIINGSTGIAAIDSCPRDRHALALLSNGKKVIGLLKLYGTVTYRVHLGEAPIESNKFERHVQIDFNGPGRVPN